MPTRKMLRAGGAIAVSSLLLAGLTGCSAEAFELAPGDRPTMAPEQAPGDACAQATAEVKALVGGMKKKFEAAGKRAAAGESPDFAAIAGELEAGLDEIAGRVGNGEVRAAVEKVREQVVGLGEIDPPDSILGMPGYLGDLGAQLGKVQKAAKSLQALCDAG